MVLINFISMNLFIWFWILFLLQLHTGVVTVSMYSWNALTEYHITKFVDLCLFFILCISFSLYFIIKDIVHPMGSFLIKYISWWVEIHFSKWEISNLNHNLIYKMKFLDQLSYVRWENSFKFVCCWYLISIVLVFVAIKKHNYCNKISLFL
jgi:hypothetical protein